MIVKSRYRNFNAFKSALERLHESGVEHYEAYGPVDLTNVEDSMPKKGSAVRIWATAWLLIGIGAFMILCIVTSRIYNIVTGGKPPVSNVPFVVVAYECVILFGAAAAFFAVLILARLKPKPPPDDYDLRFSEDSFGIEVDCDEADQERIKTLLAEGSDESR